MKKNMFSFLGLFLMVVSIFGQVGINTPNPKAVFHVDASKDNPSTGDPSTVQQGNDFAITTSGKVGIGTINPETSLEIANGTIKIVNGSQANGKVLTSNENGVGTWSFPVSPLYQIDLTGRTDFILPANASNPVYTSLSFSLPPGKFIITINLGLEMDTLNEYTIGTNFVRLRLRDSSLPTAGSTTNLSTDSIFPRFASAGSSLSQDKGMLMGSLGINNTSSGSKTYYLFVDNMSSTGAGGRPSIRLKFGWNETSILYQKVQ